MILSAPENEGPPIAPEKTKPTANLAAAMAATLSSRDAHFLSLLPISSSTFPALPCNSKLLPFPSPKRLLRPSLLSTATTVSFGRRLPCASSEVCVREPPAVDRFELSVSEAFYEDEVLAAVRLRVRTFYEFNQDPFEIEAYKRYLVEREFEGLKGRIHGKTLGFRRVSCINATLPLSNALLSQAPDLCSSCKFSDNGEDHIVVGSLDLNQCLRLADEITGKRPEGVGADDGRAYLSNVCVAKELHRNGVGYALVNKSKQIASSWGVTDLYAHVAIDNEPAKNLYIKSGFVYESDEPAWQARFLDRPRRLLLWVDVSLLCNNV